MPRANLSEARALAGPATPGLSSVQGVGPEPRRAWLNLLLLVAVLVPRLAVFAFNENLYGDAVIRTELAQNWAGNPHWITSYADGVFQFGPLQIYLMGLVLKLGVSKWTAGRWLSLIFGTVSVFPLFALTRRLFNWRAGVVAALGFSVWGMHLQMSATAGSEALALCLVLTVLACFAEGMEENRFGPLATAALLLNLACATRYESWMLIPLLCGVLWMGDKDKVAAGTRVIFFGLMCLPFPLLWMQGNEMALGSSFFPIQKIEEFHHSWVAAGVARWGNLGYRLQNLFFWPGTALVTLSPLVAIWGTVGMMQAWRRRPDVRWVLWLVWLPSLYFTVRSAVVMNFVPLARFAVVQVALLLPFVASGFDATFGSKPTRVRQLALALTVLLAVGFPVAIGIRSFRNDDGVAQSLRPISPICTNPPAVRQVADFLRNTVRPAGGSAILDTDPYYWDLQIAFFSGLPEDRLARYRWDTFAKRLEALHPAYLVRIEAGTLGASPDFHLGEHEVTFHGERFVELPGFQAPYHVYQRG